jgi:hypothetical protein
LNREKPNQFPSTIDLGKNCKIGEIYKKSLFIESQSPVTFEYEITIPKSNPEIEIETPLKGELVGNQTFEFIFSYRPLSLTTSECEIMVKTSEFDSQTHCIRLVANASPIMKLPQMTEAVAEATKTLIQ